jgi:bifunctional non-homologous end joining protein LigD
MSQLKIGAYSFELGHTERILFPESKITKGDLIAYYQQIAPTMFLHTKNRLVSMLRYPEGIDHQGFFHKETPDYFPSWIKRCTIENKTGGHTTYVRVNHKAVLVYLATQACITPHIWLSLYDKPDYPNVIVFDIDPPHEKMFERVCQTAVKLKEKIESYGLAPFLKTTGSKGLHVVVPIKRTVTFDQARAFTQAVAQKLVKTEPKFYTMEFSKKLRGEKILIDVFRNAFAQTFAAPYAVRPLEGSPVSMPIRWEDMEQKHFSSRFYTIKNAFDYVEEYGDAWEQINSHAQSIKKMIKNR